MSDYKTVYQKALYFLAKREYAIKELKTKLAKYTDDKQVIDDVINEMIKARYLSEDRYIETYINSKKSTCGLNKIKYALNTKINDVDEKLKSLEINFSFEEQLQAALNLLIRKYRFIDFNSVDYAKAIRFLYGRGFSLDVAKQAFKELKLHEE